LVDDIFDMSRSHENGHMLRHWRWVFC